MEYIIPDRKLLPYGMMNFEDIRLDNYYYIDNGKVPENMVDDNIRVADYEKVRMLTRKNDHNVSIMQTLVSQGYITGELKDGFPAVSIAHPDNFVSLLYNFGMLTISGRYQGCTKLSIPNMMVQEYLHKVVVVYKGMEMRVCEEVDLKKNKEEE